MMLRGRNAQRLATLDRNNSHLRSPPTCCEFTALRGRHALSSTWRWRWRRRRRRRLSMYNGIGLATVRGSGTNGYVQKNAAFVSRARTAETKAFDRDAKDFSKEIKEPRKPNHEIIDHNRKREVELKVFRLREELEEKGVSEEQVDEQTDALRRKLLARLPPAGSGSGRAGETHSDAFAKERENAALKKALGIRGDYVGGSAFDRELQARRAVSHRLAPSPLRPGPRPPSSFSRPQLPPRAPAGGQEGGARSEARGRGGEAERNGGRCVTQPPQPQPRPRPRPHPRPLSRAQADVKSADALDEPNYASGLFDAQGRRPEVEPCKKGAYGSATGGGGAAGEEQVWGGEERVWQQDRSEDRGRSGGEGS